MVMMQQQQRGGSVTLPNTAGVRRGVAGNSQYQCINPGNVSAQNYTLSQGSDYAIQLSVNVVVLMPSVCNDVETQLE